MCFSFYSGAIRLYIEVSTEKSFSLSHKTADAEKTIRMLNIFIRSIILYAFLLIAMRLMGKRQLGELQPFEFAITLVASDLVCLPMSDPTMPLLYGIIPVFTLFLVHILITKFASKSIRFRKILNGKPVIVIKQGNILPDVMKELNMDIDDLMEALRGKDCFNPSEVEYAIIETNGSMTVLLKSECQPLTPESAGMQPKKAELPVALIMEGKFMGQSLSETDGATKTKVLETLSEKGYEQKDVMLLMLAGKEIFVQPYKSESFVAKLGESQ